MGYREESSLLVKVRIFAQHHAGAITLSRLELWSTAITALGRQISSEELTRADMAYVFMAPLHYRIEPDKNRRHLPARGKTFPR